MSRSGYSDDCDGWSLIRWRGAVASAIRGYRGQAFLRELVKALDALPEKKLIAGDLKAPDGQVCALGSVAAVRGVDVSDLDVYDREAVAKRLGIAPALAAEIMFENDGDFFYGKMDPEERFRRVREWAVAQIVEVSA